MSDDMFQAYYNECRENGYSHSEAFMLRMHFEWRYLESQPKPDEFADLLDAVPLGGYRTRRPACQTTPREPTNGPTPQGTYQAYQPQSSHSTQAPPSSSRYHTEERRPYREPSPRPREYIPSPIFAEPPLAEGTHSTRGYRTCEAAPPHRPTRVYPTESSLWPTFDYPDDPPPRPAPTYTTSSPRSYNTTERAPRGQYTTRDRSPSPPRTHRAPPPPPPRHERTHKYKAYTPPPRSPSRPPPAEGNKPKVDLYVVLGVSRSATADEIKKAHRKLSLKWHPDRCTQANKAVATEKMALVNQANDVLGDDKARRFYDRTGCLPGLSDGVQGG